MNTFGRKFRVSIFGESHGTQVGCCIDGVPAGIALTEESLKKDLSRRRAGGKGTTPRIEADEPHIVSGVFNGKTTGAPITITFENTNTRSGDYSNLIDQPRPGHADFTGKEKHRGCNDPRGGGHFSGRITLGLVAAGAIAKLILGEAVKINAVVKSIGGSTNINQKLDEVIAAHDSVGGLVECTISGVPVGVGEPFFDSVESCIAHAVFAIPATKGVEFGSGFEAANMLGSQHNDCIIDQSGATKTNNAAGINGGITNGNDIVFRVAVKPTPSIGVPQDTFNFKTGKVEPLLIKGRHDACIALRMPVIVESVAAIALADLSLMVNG